MVERVAIAIFSATGLPEILRKDRPPGWQDEYIRQARAAIEAMREPNEAMWDGWRSVNCEHGGFGFEESTCFNGDYGNWVACHHAMIDAALGK